MGSPCRVTTISIDCVHREKHEKEIIQLRQEIRELEEGESELAAKYGEMTRKLEADVKSLVGGLMVLSLVLYDYMSSDLCFVGKEGR